MNAEPLLRMVALFVFGGLQIGALRAGETAPAKFGEATCEGAYPQHLQGVATDGNGAIFWSWTDVVVKTDLQGKLLRRVQAARHQGDLCVAGGRVFVAVNLGKFNELPGKAGSWVYVYDSETLELQEKHPVPEVVHGAGGIAEHDGRFIVIGGLPVGVEENYLYEYDASFHFVKRHVLPSGYTDKGIQTATWSRGAWWFGCYGSPQVLLRADGDFKLTGRWDFNAAVGLEGLPDGTFLLARDTASKEGHVGRVMLAEEDKERGFVPRAK